MSESVTVEIINKKGLHARAAAKFVKTVAAYSAKVVVAKAGDAENNLVSGASILGLMMLGADPGSKLQITAEGEQAEAVLKALQELVAGRFGEPE